MTETLSRSTGAEALRLLDGTVPGWMERHDMASQPPATGPSGSQPRRSISRMSAPISAGSTLRKQQPAHRSIIANGSSVKGGEQAATPAGTAGQARDSLTDAVTRPFYKSLCGRQSVRMDSAGEMNGGAQPSPGKSMGEYARRLALTQAKAGLCPLPAAKQGPDVDVRDVRPGGPTARHSDSAASSIRRASAVGKAAPRPSIRRASAAPSVGGVAPRPSISRRSVGTGSTLMAGRQPLPSIAQKSSVMEAEMEVVDEDRPRLRWRRNIGSVGSTAEEEEALRPAVDEDKVALMRRIAVLAVGEDDAVPRRRQRQATSPTAAPQEQESSVKPCPPAVSATPQMQDRHASVRSDSASSREEANIQQLKIYERAPEDSPSRQRDPVDWQPVLAAMALSPKQKRAAVDARLALSEALQELQAQRSVLYKTLCSFATTDADEGLEEAICATKQELVQNEEAEAEELRAFRYTFRSALAGPLLAARSAISAACPGASPDFLALADAITVDLRQSGDGLSSGVPAAAPPPQTRRRSRAVVNPAAILEDVVEEDEAEA